MGNAHRSRLFLTGIILIASGLPRATLAQSPGGSYTLQFDRNKSIVLTSLDFGGARSVAPGVAELSQVEATASTGFESFASILHACQTAGHFNKAEIVYRDAQGQAEYTVEYRKVTITSASFPGVSNRSGAPPDFAWSFAAAEEKFIRPAGAESGSGLSKYNQERLARARVAIQRMMWNDIKGKGLWRSSPKEISPPPSGMFSLDIPGVDTSGVIAVGPLVATQSAGSGSGSSAQATFSLLTLTVDTDKAAGFSAANKSGAPLASGALTYFRLNDDNREQAIKLTLKSLVVKSASPSDEVGGKPTVQVELEFQTLDFKVTN